MGVKKIGQSDVFTPDMFEKLPNYLLDLPEEVVEAEPDMGGDEGEAGGEEPLEDEAKEEEDPKYEEAKKEEEPKLEDLKLEDQSQP